MERRLATYTTPGRSSGKPRVTNAPRARIISSGRSMTVEQRMLNRERIDAARNGTEIPVPALQVLPPVPDPTQILEDAPVTNQQAGINWLVPLVILGGFFVASKLKKKNVDNSST